MSSNTDFLLAVEDLTVSFDGFKAIDGLNFYMDEKELRVVIGPNGAGKTTLLDLICGKTKATNGSIKFRGKELTRLPEHRIVWEGVGRKFQTPSIYDSLTVQDNLEVSYPRGRGVWGALAFKRDAALQEKTREVAESVLLQDALDLEAGQLSHGQKQWLEIGMLLMQRPRLLLVDEPVAGMTEQEMERTGELLTSLAGKQSVVVVEHDMGFVRSIARQVTVLHQGSVLAEGSMDQVSNDPKVIEVYLGQEA